MNKPNEPGELGLSLLPRMNELTLARFGELAMTNARRNLAVACRGKSLTDLRGLQIGDGKSAVVVAAGPSVKRHDPARVIQDFGYTGAVVATESAMHYCLRGGLVPDLVVSVDPQPAIARWFGDPSLSDEEIQNNDYFRRQDLDDAFADERRANDALLRALKAHGPQIRIALSTTASAQVVQRVLDLGMDLYWWNPMLDDPEGEGSLTAELYALNGFPCVNAGGNVGSASWMMADAVLGVPQVAITGMDFGYYDGTPLERTQYYYAARDLVGEEHLESLFMRIHNPHEDAWFFTDPAYRWYREAFLEMVQDAQATTHNCTGGGILFGEGIRWSTLQDFIRGISRPLTREPEVQRGASTASP